MGDDVSDGVQKLRAQIAREMGGRLGYMRKVALHEGNTVDTRKGETLETKIGTFETPGGRLTRGRLADQLTWLQVIPVWPFKIAWIFYRSRMPFSRMSPGAHWVRHLSVTIYSNRGPEFFDIAELGPELELLLLDEVMMAMLFENCEAQIRVGWGDPLERDGKLLHPMVVHVTGIEQPASTRTGLPLAAVAALQGAPELQGALHRAASQGAQGAQGAQEGDIVPVQVKITSADGTERIEQMDGRVVRLDGDET